MKKIMVMIAIIALSVANFPVAVFGEEVDIVETAEVAEENLVEPADDETGIELELLSDETDQSIDDETEDGDTNDDNGGSNNLSQDIYISEIYANPSDPSLKYIELYINADIAEGSYNLMTATSETGALSPNFLVNLTNRKADDYHLVIEQISSNLNLTNPSGAGSRLVWLCPVGITKDQCRSDGYLDKVEYANHGALQSFSRDFGDSTLPFKLSLQTPGAANKFSADANDDDDGEETVELDTCAYISLNEISFSEPEKFIEIINTTAQTIDLTDCALRRGNGYIYLDGELTAGEIKSFDVANSTLVQTNSSVNIYVYDILQKKNVATVAYKAKSGASYAWLTVGGVEGWYSTFAMTPGAENIYQQFQTCEAGKHINTATGNCVKDPEPPAECAENQYRNPETGRCKKLDSEKTLAECAAGQFRNPLTNRCKKIASDDELSPCAEGWERNPETNRCRKTPIGSEAAYAVGPMSQGGESRTWLWIGAGGVVLLGAMIAWQFHPEISRLWSKLIDRIKR
jgi:hypothetical protein